MLRSCQHLLEHGGTETPAGVLSVLTRPRFVGTTHDEAIALCQKCMAEMLAFLDARVPDRFRTPG